MTEIDLRMVLARAQACADGLPGISTLEKGVTAASEAKRDAGSTYKKRKMS
jgi:hypothetical protein